MLCTGFSQKKSLEPRWPLLSLGVLEHDPTAFGSPVTYRATANSKVEPDVITFSAALSACVPREHLRPRGSHNFGLVVLLQEKVEASLTRPLAVSEAFPVAVQSPVPLGAG